MKSYFSWHTDILINEASQCLHFKLFIFMEISFWYVVILFNCDPLYYSRTDNVEFLKRHSDLLSHIGINTIDIEKNSFEALSVCSILSKTLNLPPNAHQLPQTWVGVFEVRISHGDFGFDHLKTPPQGLEFLIENLNKETTLYVPEGYRLDPNVPTIPFLLDIRHS